MRVGKDINGIPLRVQLCMGGRVRAPPATIYSLARGSGYCPQAP